MTVIYNDYYPAIASGQIDLKNVNFSAYVCDETYTASPTHKKVNVTGKVETLVKVLVEGDISTLTMSEIIDKIKIKLSDEELKKAKCFVVYDIASGKLCFSEELQ
jgi:hypothetical protein